MIKNSLFSTQLLRLQLLRIELQVSFLKISLLFPCSLQGNHDKTISASQGDSDDSQT